MPQQIPVSMPVIKNNKQIIQFLDSVIKKQIELLPATAFANCNNKIKFIEQILQYQRTYDLWPDTFIYDESLHKDFINLGMEEIIKHIANLAGEYNYVILSVPRMGKSQSDVFKRISTTQLCPPPDPFARRRPGDE